MKTKRSTMVAMAAAFAAAMAMGEAAQAVDCVGIGGVDAAGDCTLSQVFVCAGNTTVDIPGNLTITGTGAITCGSNALDLNVGGNLLVMAGGAITADGSDGGASHEFTYGNLPVGRRTAAAHIIKRKSIEKPTTGGCLGSEIPRIEETPSGGDPIMKTKRSTMVAMAAAFSAALALGDAAQAQLNCTDIGGVEAAGTCTLSMAFDCTVNPTHIVIPGNFTIAVSGAIDCGSNDLNLDVGGDLNVLSGGVIAADGSDGGAGGDGGYG